MMKWSEEFISDRILHYVNIQIFRPFVADIENKNKKNSYLCAAICGRGVIGSRARLRIWCLTAWGFESLRPHT